MERRHQKCVKNPSWSRHGPGIDAYDIKIAAIFLKPNFRKVISRTIMTSYISAIRLVYQ